MKHPELNFTEHERVTAADFAAMLLDRMDPDDEQKVALTKNPFVVCQGFTDALVSTIRTALWVKEHGGIRRTRLEGIDGRIPDGHYSKDDVREVATQLLEHVFNSTPGVWKEEAVS